MIYVNSEAKKDKAGDILYLLASTNPEHFSKFWSKSLNTVFKVKQEEIVHLLGTTFSGGLIIIWCSSEYLWQEDVCVWDYVNINYIVCVHCIKKELQCDSLMCF